MKRPPLLPLQVAAATAWTPPVALLAHLTAAEAGLTLAAAVLLLGIGMGR